MLRVIPFEPAHARGARAHPTQARFQSLLDDPAALRRGCWIDQWSAFDADVLVATGAIVDLEGRAAGWVLFTDKLEPRHFMGVHRCAVRMMRELEKIGDPLVAHVDPANPVAVRWAALLGMASRGFDQAPDGRNLMRMSA